MSVPCAPPGVDPDVFASLPPAIQAELCEEAINHAIAASGSADAPRQDSVPTAAAVAPFPLTFLTYNLWFRDLELAARMNAVVRIVEETAPTFIGLQEVIADMLPVLRPKLEALGYTMYLQDRVTDFYGVALCSRVPLQGVTHVPFGNTVMARELLFGQATVTLASGSKCTVIVGTAHLESVAEAKSRREVERREQAETAFAALDDAVMKGRAACAVFAGDVNWTDPVPRGNKWDGAYPLAAGWQDVWLSCPSSLRDCGSAQSDGYTYDCISNPMLSGKLRYRSDRAFVRGSEGNSVSVTSVRLVGTTPIPGLTYTSTNPYNGVVKTLPVLPSDHFGVLVSLCLANTKKRGEAASASTERPQPAAVKKRHTASSGIVTVDESD
jgi:tyrosyl-DNA phosphodiesterase 2